MSNSSYPSLIPRHGGYKKLMSYQMSEIVYDLTVIFTKKYIPFGSRTRDQMDQAARSGKQNIVEASVDSGTSKKVELKLVGIARGSLEELLNDYQDFIRQNNLKLWGVNDPRVKHIRSLAYVPNKSHTTYLTYTNNPEAFCNCLVCIIHQTNFLLDRQLLVLQKEFLEKGGFTERLYNFRRSIKPN